MPVFERERTMLIFAIGTPPERSAGQLSDAIRVNLCGPLERVMRRDSAPRGMSSGNRTRLLPNKKKSGESIENGRKWEVVNWQRAPPAVLRCRLLSCYYPTGLGYVKHTINTRGIITFNRSVITCIDFLSLSQTGTTILKSGAIYPTGNYPTVEPTNIQIYGRAVGDVDVSSRASKFYTNRTNYAVLSMTNANTSSSSLLLL